MNQKKYKTKPGAISMITVMLMSIILMVLVIGLVQIMLNEQRQSSDNELTNRAFYTAEAGLESARQHVSELSDSEVKLLATQSLAEAPCLANDPELLGGIGAALISDDNYEAEVVCQKVAGVDGTYTVGPDIGINNAVKYDLGTNKDSVRFDWAVRDGVESETFRSDSSLPAQSVWTSPAALRIQLYWFEPNMPRADLKNSYSEFYVLPGNSANSPTHSFNVTDQPVLARCSVGAFEQKMCSIEINSIPANVNRILYVRMSYLYESTEADITPLTGGLTDDSLSGQLRVDSTGRVGDVYRRIQANIDLGDPGDVPNYTVLGNQICKSFDITDRISEFASINGGSSILDDYCTAN
jgi:hypothetical protein